MGWLPAFIRVHLFLALFQVKGEEGDQETNLRICRGPGCFVGGRFIADSNFKLYTGTCSLHAWSTPGIVSHVTPWLEFDVDPDIYYIRGFHNYRLGASMPRLRARGDAVDGLASPPSEQ